ncbi:TadE family type IV pilus minor pilin [Amycolatopsis sp. GM8]|uniref:TadE family type IV pilus minor pilin n=1 Tax=Amycolatopsis sp. GM8 TaxID=2896530 RepID=UPI001F2BD1F6|nr:TadE family type IV pilus minor pilin [Amycolatopsis sp. GM8]
MSPPARPEADRGAVTVEAAIALGALTLVLGLVLAGVAAVAGQLRCADAAREAARLIARGDRPLAEQAVTQIAPGARLQVDLTGNAVTVDVTAEPAGGLLPGVHLRGHAYALLEPGAPDAPG